MEKIILSFYESLAKIDHFEGLPADWTLVNPYREHWDRFSFFIKKYYAHGDSRDLIIALNPGRFGCNQTGITMTDERILKTKLGFPGSISKPIGENTATRIYGVIEEVEHGDFARFFSKYFMTNVFPFGIVTAKGTNALFSELIKIPSIKTFSIDFVKQSIALFKPKRLICIGKGSENFIKEHFPGTNSVYLHHPARTFPENKKQEYRKVLS